MKKLLAHIKLFRPLNLTIGAVAVIITASILKNIDRVSVWLTAMLVVVCYNAAANAINDYFDLKTDRINRPKRPLVTGIVKPQTALILSIFLFGAGTVLALTLPLSAAIIAIAVALPLMVLYSIWLKGLPLAGNIVIAFILGITFLFVGAALGDVQTMIIPALLAFGLTLTRELIKDIADTEGDTKSGLKTFPVVVGVKQASQLAIMLAVAIAIGAVAPYIFDYYNFWYIIFVIFGVEIPLLITVVLLMKNEQITAAKRSAQLLKFSTIAGVLAVWLGSF